MDPENEEEEAIAAVLRSTPEYVAAWDLEVWKAHERHKFLESLPADQRNMQSQVDSLAAKLAVEQKQVSQLSAKCKKYELELEREKTSNRELSAVISKLKAENSELSLKSQLGREELLAAQRNLQQQLSSLQSERKQLVEQAKLGNQMAADAAKMSMEAKGQLEVLREQLANAVNIEKLRTAEALKTLTLKEHEAQELLKENKAFKAENEKLLSQLHSAEQKLIEEHKTVELVQFQLDEAKAKLLAVSQAKTHYKKQLQLLAQKYNAVLQNQHLLEKATLQREAERIERERSIPETPAPKPAVLAIPEPDWKQEISGFRQVILEMMDQEQAKVSTHPQTRRARRLSRPTSNLHVPSNGGSTDDSP
eukprot:TRINITY_DN21930_c2_g1_i1.p2 TRINITY_DN21930_c2_g1~~TRINITY_DN21930_c2_g1_i1.p2  ORF type:complete len:376 (-),score=77.35 TRINITY_DN21930_c2_g1_i1:1625-2719(-)